MAATFSIVRGSPATRSRWNSWATTPSRRRSSVGHPGGLRPGSASCAPPPRCGSATGSSRPPARSRRPRRWNASSTRRWTLSRPAYRVTPSLRTLPSMALRTTTGPSQFSATIVDSRAARCGSRRLTNRRCDRARRRPSGSSKTVRRVSTARRGSSSTWCSTTRASRSSNQPAGPRTASGSQFGSVHDALVGDLLPVDLGVQPVEHPGEVGPGVVDTVGASTPAWRHGSPGSRWPGCTTPRGALPPRGRRPRRPVASRSSPVREPPPGRDPVGRPHSRILGRPDRRGQLELRPDAASWR